MYNITDFINNTESLLNTNAAMVEDLVKKYPYSQTAQLLLLLKYKRSKNLLYNKQLSLATAYTKDINHLFNLVNDNAITPPVLKEELPQEETVKAEALVSPAPIKIEETVVEKQKPAEETPEEKQKRMQDILNQRLKEINSEKEQQESDNSLDEKKKLIDDFISAEPRIQPKRDAENETDLSENSVVDNVELASETLAQIYAKQGNYEKAIKTYEKLSLKYPEKITYFAAQIETFKNQLNK